MSNLFPDDLGQLDIWDRTGGPKPAPRHDYPRMRNRDPEKAVAFGTAVVCVLVLAGLVVALLVGA